ncbi:MAG TPA: 23S rRNA (adenine(2503)-C(2))-methyltransferase RlmN [Candidatus Limnocylindria bacterium]|nr:23S rRNA (adenine(2503)-C(2))-methyltransferase RlmN [Candidatus Limnocylindria bacterium]
MSEARAQLAGMDMGALSAFLQGLGAPSYRAAQVRDWLVRGVDFDGMRNLPAALLERLREVSVAQPARVLERHKSQDGTEKLLFGLMDSHVVEGVLMRYAHGITLCLSTQVGCLMGCAFCASTLEGKLRDLTRGEMMGMAYLAGSISAPERLHNIVLMGSGEPLDNYDEVVAFLRMASSPDFLGIGIRHISLSTCGLVDRMKRLAGEGLPVTLSVSLHAPSDSIRNEIMPVARANPLPALLEACRHYIQMTGRRVIFEYALIRGLNAEPRHAQELASRLRGMQCHVNLIPLNDVPERDLRGATAREVRAFQAELEALGISVTVRRRLGDDVAGACGQLRARRLKTPLPGAQVEGGE